MNKSKVNELIPAAVKAIEELGIAENNIIKKTFRGQISTFGAAISGGSLLAAVAFFSDKGNASVDRVKLTKAIYQIITKSEPSGKDCLYNYVIDRIGAHEERKCKEDILNAAIALKIAMNVYTLAD